MKKHIPTSKIHIGLKKKIRQNLSRVQRYMDERHGQLQRTTERGERRNKLDKNRKQYKIEDAFIKGYK